MEYGKNITIRLKDYDLQEFDIIAKKHNLNRTELIKRAVYEFTGNANANIIESAKEIIGSASKDLVLASRHDLVERIYKDGIKIHEDGEVIAEIRSLYSLIEFVNTKVLTEK
jgi:predicted transcriptional regulator